MNITRRGSNVGCWTVLSSGFSPMSVLTPGTHARRFSSQSHLVATSARSGASIRRRRGNPLSLRPPGGGAAARRGAANISSTPADALDALTSRRFAKTEGQRARSCYRKRFWLYYPYLRIVVSKPQHSLSIQFFIFLFDKNYYFTYKLSLVLVSFFEIDRDLYTHVQLTISRVTVKDFGSVIHISLSLSRSHNFFLYQ